MFSSFYSRLRQLFTRESKLLTREEKKQRRKDALLKPRRSRQLRV